MTNEMANAEEVERVVEEHLTAGDKSSAIAALLAWARELRKGGHHVDAAAAEERARAIDPSDARHAPLSARAASKSSAPSAMDAPGSAPELVATEEEEALDSGWGEAADAVSESDVPAEASVTAPPTGPATSVTAPPGGPVTAPPTTGPATAPPSASPSTEDAKAPSDKPLPISSETAAMLGAAPTSPEPAISAMEPTAPGPPPAMSIANAEPAGPEILSFNSVPPPADKPSDAPKDKPKELTRTLRSAQSDPPPAASSKGQRFGDVSVAGEDTKDKSATAPPPSNKPKHGDPLFADDDEMFEEDVSDQTSIMGLEERRALQKATRAGDAAALKATAEKIAADHEAAQHAARGGPVSKEDFERPTVPPPSMKAAPEVKPDDASDTTTAPPPALVDTKRPPSQTSPISPLSETVDAPQGAPKLAPDDRDDDDDDGDEHESRPISRHDVPRPAPAAAATALAAKKPEPNFMLFVIAAIVVLAIVAAFALR